MRVISGYAKGHKLVAPKGFDTRPTTDRIKESLFNIISNDLNGIYFLDLFSGTGSIGIEALSRGAEKSFFVDYSKECEQIIIKNLKATKMYDKAIVIKDKAVDAIYNIKKKDVKFDIIFMDPPYGGQHIENTLKSILHTNILSQDGYIIIEQGINDIFPAIEGFDILRIKDYKTTKMTFIKYMEDSV